jgi:hypothetical protein
MRLVLGGISKQKFGGQSYATPGGGFVDFEPCYIALHLYLDNVNLPIFQMTTSLLNYSKFDHLFDFTQLSPNHLLQLSLKVSSIIYTTQHCQNIDIFISCIYITRLYNQTHDYYPANI